MRDWNGCNTIANSLLFKEGQAVSEDPDFVNEHGQTRFNREEPWLESVCQLAHDYIDEVNLCVSHQFTPIQVW